MIYKRVLLAVVFLALTILSAHPVLAAKVRVRKPRAVRPAGISYSSAKLSRSTNSVILTFLNLSGVSSVSYELGYTAAGIPQGAMGSISVSGQSADTRDLYFGTCSHGVCTTHYNIQNAYILVTTSFTNGTEYIKRYKIKL